MCFYLDLLGMALYYLQYLYRTLVQLDVSKTLIPFLCLEIPKCLFVEQSCPLRGIQWVSWFSIWPLISYI